MLEYLRAGSAQTTVACCHTEKEVADQTLYLTHSQDTDTWPTSLSAGRVAIGVPI